MERVTRAALSGLILAVVAGCASTDEAPEKTWEQIRAERVADFMLHLNNRSETERHRNGLVEVGVKSPEDRAYVIAQSAEAYEKSIQRGGTGTGVLRTAGRRRVMEVVSRLPKDPEGMKLLRRGLRDTPEVQIPASSGLVAFGEPGALGKLVSATLSVVDKTARQQGLKQLRTLAIETRRDEFLSALGERGADVLRPVLLQTFPSAEQDKRAALRSVAGDHQNPYARAFALNVLGGLKDAAAVELARKALQGEDPVVRPTALRVLGTAGGDKAAGELERVLRNDPDDGDAVVLGLYGVGTAEALRRALDLAGSDEISVRTRVSLITGFLGRVREAKAPKPYRREAARTSTLEVLRELMSDRESRLVIAAVGAIGRVGVTTRDVRPLLRLLSDPTPTVGKAVVEALGLLGGPYAGSKLVSLVEKDNVLRTAAAQAFRTFPRAKDVPVNRLIDCLSDDVLEVRQAAILSLRNLTKSDAKGYDPGARESSRALAIDKWRAWWKARKG